MLKIHLLRGRRDEMAPSADAERRFPPKPATTVRLKPPNVQSEYAKKRFSFTAISTEKDHNLHNPLSWMILNAVPACRYPGQAIVLRTQRRRDGAGETLDPSLQLRNLQRRRLG